MFSFSDETDARRVLRTLPKRFGKFELRLHPEKTKLVDFRRPRDENKPKGGPSGEIKSFDFLSFTHYWAKSRKGKWVIKRKTAKSRLARAIATINIWCKENLHRPIPE